MTNIAQEAIEPILNLVREDEIEKAFSQARVLLTSHHRTDEIISLDVIESEWSDIEEKSVGGLLSVDDSMRLNNINREKFIRLLRMLDQPVHNRVAPSFAATAAPIGITAEASVAPIGDAFKKGLKNVVGVICIFTGITLTATAPERLSGIFLILAGLICAIPTLLIIERMVGRPLPSYVKYILFIGFAIGFVMAMPQTETLISQ
jgi:hypothetical protein